LAQLPFEEEIRFPATPQTAVLSGELAPSGELATDDGVYRFRPRAGYPMSSFYGLTEARSLSARLFTSQRPTLEALFLQLTGRTLRE
jgi:ABC-2 type transport system ATP-binding protein